MKKSLIIPFILLCMMLFAIPACAMKNEPDNFRGIPWGAEASKGNLKKWGLSGFMKATDFATVYLRNEDDVSIGGAEITVPIRYIFHDSLGLCMVIIMFKGQEQYNLIRKTCHESWGVPDGKRRQTIEEINYDFEEIFWAGELIYAQLEYYHEYLGTSKTGEGNLSIVLNNLEKTLEQEIAIQRQKENGF